MSTFDQIFLKYYHSLLLYGLKFIRDENDVHDIVQEVFVTVWEKEKYTFSDAHLKAYLFNSVRNGCLNHIRHQSVVNKHIEKQELSLLINELNFYGSGEKSLIEKESLKEIYAAIESLPPKQKEMIELSRFEGLKNKEIAKKLGIPLRTVETRLFRALSGLRKVLTGNQIYILFNLVVRHKADNP